MSAPTISDQKTRTLIFLDRGHVRSMYSILIRDGDQNFSDGNGEGFVHVHRGFFGVGGELTAKGYDWRNPMMRVEVSRS